MSSITKFSKTCKCFYLCSGCISARPGKAIMLKGLEKGFLLYGDQWIFDTNSKQKINFDLKNKIICIMMTMIVMQYFYLPK